MNKPAPSVAAVERARYVLRFALRLVGGFLVVWTAAHLVSTSANYVMAYHGRLGEGLVVALQEWLSADGARAMVAVLVLVFEQRIVGWIAPMPRPVCPNCGYPLPREGAGKCPECGTGLG